MIASAKSVRQLPAAFLTEAEALDLMRDVYRQAFFMAAEREPHADKVVDPAEARADTRRRFFDALTGLFVAGLAARACECGVIDQAELSEIMSGG